MPAFLISRFRKRRAGVRQPDVLPHDCCFTLKRCYFLGPPVGAGILLASGHRYVLYESGCTRPLLFHTILNMPSFWISPMYTGFQVCWFFSSIFFLPPGASNSMPYTAWRTLSTSKLPA